MMLLLAVLLLFVWPDVDPPGRLAVQASPETTLHDAARDKDLPVHAWIPRTGGKRPVIVFSHGAGGSGNQAAAKLAPYWASHGYVVLAPTHADSVGLQRRRGGKAKGGVSATLKAIRGESGDQSHLWRDRVRDLRFLLDAAAELEEKIPELAGKADWSRVGVGGHSLGAYTAQVAGGAKVDFQNNGRLESLADPRCRAVLMLSGQGTGQLGLVADSWKELKCPMLVVTGNLDRGVKGQDPAWRREPFAGAAPGDKYFASFEGGNHGSFTGGLLERGLLLKRKDGAAAGLVGRPTSPDDVQKRIFLGVQLASRHFWDAYLMDDAAAKAWLRSDSLPKAVDGKVTFERR